MSTFLIVLTTLVALASCANTGRSNTNSAAHIALQPHQLSIRSKDFLCPECPYKQTCAGSLISSRMAVTSAHCIIGTVASQYQIVAGTELREGNHGTIAPLKEIIMHEDYNPKQHDNDIALLILGIDMPLNNFTINTIELTERAARAGATATVSGWGTASTVQEDITDVLQSAKVTAISHEKCNEAYEGLITNAMLCVSGTNACQGDHGGPLVMDGKLAGVFSWGCDNAEKPSVYADISHLRSWLLEKIAQHS